MTIDNERTARQFVGAWAGHIGARRAYKMAAESQYRCASIAGFGTETGRQHLRAMNVLERAVAAVKS